MEYRTRNKIHDLNPSQLSQAKPLFQSYNLSGTAWLVCRKDGLGRNTNLNFDNNKTWQRHEVHLSGDVWEIPQFSNMQRAFDFDSSGAATRFVEVRVIIYKNINPAAPLYTK